MDRNRPALFLAAAVALTAAAALAAQAADWPQFRGPARDGISHETGLLKSWPEGGPKLLWKAQGLGEGHSTVAVTGGKIYSMGLREGKEAVWALDVDGKPLWMTP